MRKNRQCISLLLTVVMVLTLLCQGIQPVQAEESVTAFVYEAENFYSGSISEGIAADMQPGEAIAIQLSSNEAFTDGTYTVSVASCGNRESFEILVNGESKGTITRAGTSFGQDQITEDALGTVLELKTTDVVTIQAPADGYGWVDKLTLTAAEAPAPEVSAGATESGEGWLLYHAEHFYSGNISEGIAADMQPGESIELPLNTNTAMADGTYTLTIHACGNRTAYEILVNGESKGTVTRAGTAFSSTEFNDAALSEPLELKTGDVLTVSAPSDGTYGWVDWIMLTAVEDPEPEEPSGATQTGEGYYLYQTEFFYSGNISEGIAADMQPGETIDVKPGSNKDFADGTYTVSVASCGNRESFEILVNGESKGTITRAGTGFGQDQITEDALELTLTLKASDVVTIKAPADGYGWVDYLKLTAVEEPEPELPEGATQTGEGYYLYQTEYFYAGNISEGIAADMQPGETIDVKPGSNKDFADGTYTVSVASCGNRESFEILVNGESKGTITRAGTNFGQDQITEDALELTLTLKASDVITIKAPADGYGWVDYLKLTAVEEPEPELPEGATQTGEGYYLYQTEYFYAGNISEGIAADMQPGETIDVKPGSNKDFADGTYTVSVASCGNRESFEILVNGESKGTITRAGTGFGQDQITEDALELTLTLKASDVVTIKAPADGYGWVDYLKLTAVEEPEPELPEGATQTGEGYYLYQMEYFYAGNISEGIAADMQPGETIDVKPGSNKDFADGTYTLSVASCGNRESFEILVNGESKGTITRAGTGFGQDQITEGALELTLTLKASDVVTIKAPADGYGWVDYLKLTAADAPIPELPEGATEAHDTYLLYQAEYFYGKTAENVTADLQPGGVISIPVSVNPGFTPGTYTVVVYSCGNRETFDVLLNGASVGTINRTGTGFGLNQLTYDKLTATTLTLTDGDVISLVGPTGANYGWVDFMMLDKGDTRFTGTTGSKPSTPTSQPTETHDSYFVYQTEHFYHKTAENVTADLQPGESIDIPLSENKDFTDGIYTLSITSCGNREIFTIKVNGEVVGTVSRAGTGFGMDQMTSDKLMTALELKAGDTLTIEDSGGESYGWVDFIVLDMGDTTKASGEPTEQGDGWYLYQAEFFYNKLAETTAADLQPGTAIEIPLDACEGFSSGWYIVTVAACGPRETIYLRLNGKTIGSISRLETGYGMDEMTESRYKVKLELSGGDVLTLAAPDDGTYGWVDYVRLDAVEPPADAANDVPPTETEASEEPTEPEEPAQEDGNWTIPVVVGGIALCLLIMSLVTGLLKKKK